MLNNWKLLSWITVIGILTLTPGNELREVKINIPHFDKIVHFGLFFIMGLLIKGLHSKVKTTVTSWLVFASVYAGAIEVLQWQFIPMRSGDWIDFTADILGLFAGFYSFSLLPTFFEKMATVNRYR